MAVKSMKETETVGMRNWELMNQFLGYLTSLGVVCPDPSHEAEDGFASIRWISSGLAATKAASVQWGHHFARVAWTGAFSVMKSITPLPARQIKGVAKPLKASCNGNFAKFKRLQSEVLDDDRYFGREFWGPSGLDLARSAAPEAVGEDLSRSARSVSEEGPSNTSMEHDTGAEGSTAVHTDQPALEAALEEEEAPAPAGPSSRPQV